MTKIEEVARAIALAEGARMVGPGQSAASREVGWKGDGVHNDVYVERHWREYTTAAQLAIGAMRRPSEQMLFAASQIMGGGIFNHHSDLETWQTMVDAALKDFSMEDTNGKQAHGA